MKNLLSLIAILFSATLQAGNSKAIRDLTSDDGHTVMVAEYISKGVKTTLVSLSFENKVCIKDVVMFNGSNDNLTLEWKSGTSLDVKVSGDIEIKSSLKGKYLECGLQKIEIALVASNA
jgi:hypothetical protein